MFNFPCPLQREPLKLVLVISIVICLSFFPIINPTLSIAENVIQSQGADKSAPAAEDSDTETFSESEEGEDENMDLEEDQDEETEIEVHDEQADMPEQPVPSPEVKKKSKQEERTEQTAPVKRETTKDTQPERPERTSPPPKTKKQPKAEPTVSFFFDDADVFEVAQTVFGDILKVNYIIDPQVKGRVNFRTVTPIPK